MDYQTLAWGLFGLVSYLVGLYLGKFFERSKYEKILERRDAFLAPSLERMTLRMIHIRNLYMSGKPWFEIRELVWIGVEEMIDLKNDTVKTMKGIK